MFDHYFADAEISNFVKTVARELRSTTRMRSASADTTIRVVTTMTPNHAATAGELADVLWLATESSVKPNEAEER
jgi:hypothetical protein